MARYDFLDWLKAIGITFVVYGHVAHATTVPLTPPVYLKQFGVICFLFATTFTLARDTRGTAAAVFVRLFPIFLFGLATAATLTAIGMVTGARLVLSNYLPFTFGANVLFDHFPANPSTWYLGTYIHLILLWALCRNHLRVRLWMVFAAAFVEIPVRAALLMFAGPYVAYMLLSNWIAVCLFGLWCGRTLHAGPSARSRVRGYGTAAGVLLLVITIMWHPLAFAPAFPFMTIHEWAPLPSALAVSAMASLLYLFGACALFEGTTRLGPAPRMVTFLARNSLLIFLLHMPIYFALRPWLISLGLSYEARALVQFIVCLPVLGVLSEIIARLVPAKRLAERTAAATTNWWLDERAFPTPLARQR